MTKPTVASLLALSLLSAPAFAGHHLTTAQLSTLKADIAAPCAALDDQACADLYNQLAAPDYWLHRERVCKDELVGATSVDATTFNWTGNGFITRSAGEQAAFREIFDADGCVNPSRPNVRQAFIDIFSGTGNAAANRMHLATIGRERATRAEKLFATGTGSTASPAKRGLGVAGFVIGILDPQDISEARNLP